MYTPPVTPWESEMPEVGDLTITNLFALKEPPKAGLITGVKS